MTARRTSRPTHRSLAPSHLGEAASVALVSIGVLGFAIFIAGVAMAVSGLTLGGSYGDAPPPPNIGELATVQVLGGIGLIALGALLVATTIGAFADVRLARPGSLALSALAAVLAAIGCFLLVTQSDRDLVLAGALGVIAIAFGVAAIVLGRPAT